MFKLLRSASARLGVLAAALALSLGLLGCNSNGDFGARPGPPYPDAAFAPGQSAGDGGAPIDGGGEVRVSGTARPGR